MQCRKLGSQKKRGQVAIGVLNEILTLNIVDKMMTWDIFK